MKIVFSKRFRIHLNALLVYLENEWSEKSRRKFEDVLLTKIHSIRKHPEAYKESGKKTGVRQCVITKHTSLFYRIKDNEIQVITLFDTRQNPGKLKL